LTTYDENLDYSPCPFADGAFQWMSNICFAEAYAKAKNIRCETYLVYYKSSAYCIFNKRLKCPISDQIKDRSYLGSLKDQIKDTKSLAPISYNSLVDKAILSLKDDSEKKVWKNLKAWIEQKVSQL